MSWTARVRRYVVVVVAAAIASTLLAPASAGAATVLARDDSGVGFVTAEDTVLVTGNVLDNDVTEPDDPTRSVETFYFDGNSIARTIATGEEELDLDDSRPASVTGPVVRSRCGLSDSVWWGRSGTG